jgi:hypothetical protein
MYVKATRFLLLQNILNKFAEKKKNSSCNFKNSVYNYAHILEYIFAEGKT